VAEAEHKIRKVAQAMAAAEAEAEVAPTTPAFLKVELAARDTIQVLLVKQVAAL
jgi:hypothetical protein